MAFKTKRPNGRSNADMLFEHVCDWEPDEQISHREGMRLLDTKNIHDFYQTVAVTNRRLLAERERKLRVVRGIGYRIAHAREHLEMQAAQEKRAKRAVKNALSIGRNCKMEELTSEEREKQLAKNNIVTAKVQIMTASDARIKRWDNLRGSL